MPTATYGATYGPTPPPAGASAALLAAWPSLSPTAQQQLAQYPNAVLRNGNWFTPAGDFIVSSQAKGETDAQKTAEVGPVQTDPTTGKQFEMVDGKRWYIPPMANPDGTPFAPGQTGNPGGGGGLVHGMMQWDPATGTYSAPLDWGKILSMVTAGIITAGAADAALASTPALASTAPAGASATTSAPTLEGVAAGGGGAATTVPTTAAGVSTIPAATYGPTGAVTNFASVPAESSPAATGLSVTDALRYGLPTVGNVVSNLIQANASGNASAEQQKYLEEALAYQKEQDALNRKIAADKVQLEAGRYATYSGNISPYLATGTAANSKMSNLLGLPASAPLSAPPPAAAPASTTPPAAAPASGSVRMQAPDGSFALVSQADVANATAKGAKLVNAPSGMGA